MYTIQKVHKIIALKPIVSLFGNSTRSREIVGVRPRLPITIVCVKPIKRSRFDLVILAFHPCVKTKTHPCQGITAKKARDHNSTGNNESMTEYSMVNNEPTPVKQGGDTPSSWDF